MTVCSHTGISVPECSCRACLQAQIERHMPPLRDEDAASTAPTIEMAAVSRLSRLRLPGRLRRLRRAA
jgi:3-phenylpropionate/cinnamic acid dioxygenase small subunit